MSELFTQGPAAGALVAPGRVLARPDDRKEALAVMTRQQIGRALQFVGLLILPFGIASELVERVGLGQSLLIASGGIVVFYVGYVMQHRS